MGKVSKRYRRQEVQGAVLLSQEAKRRVHVTM